MSNIKKLQKLPLGIQTFSEIIEGNYLYVDKTQIAFDLIEDYKYVFLSRPRRFGKSLFLDTLHNIFEGHKSRFEGLAIYDQWNWETKYPVIKISFAGNLRSSQRLQENLLNSLAKNRERLGLPVDTTVNNIDIAFSRLIEACSIKYDQKIVVLIDEYDKAILDNLDQIEVANENREIIKGFYSILKDCDQFLRFVFLTGVSKFTKTSIFSGLNNITDISLNKKYGNICGYTQQDIETQFLPYLKEVDLGKLKRWYNGYNFLKDDVYNPFDILQFIQNDCTYRNYWFATGTPTFLIKLIEANRYFLPKLSNLVINEKLLESFDIENLDFEVLLYQTGYLTIDKMIISRRGTIEYKLKLPNEEVKSSLNDFILDALMHKNAQKQAIQNALYDALYDGDIDDIHTSLKSMFASVAHNNFRKNDMEKYEGFYASLVYVYLQSLGCDIIGEDVTNHGNIDLTIKINNIIYIIEFKMGKGEALKQIKEKKYAEKYLALKQDIYLVGINFDEADKNISQFEWEKLC